MQSEPYSCKSREYILSVNIFRSDHNETKLKPNDTYPCYGREQNLPTNIFHSEHIEIKIKPIDTYDEVKA